MEARGVKRYYVYILSSASGTLYAGATNDLEGRVYQHKQKLIPGFTARYNVERLVYFEETSSVQAAFAREKQVKGWSRAKKVALVASMNPNWVDLSHGWYDAEAE